MSLSIPARIRNSFFLAALGLLMLPPASTHAGDVLLGGPQPAITPTAEIGTLAGSFTVDDAGSAHYSIPLALPAGTNGVAPSLAFVYDSAAGNGELGMGWSLGGQSAIGRCPTNLAIDGVVAPVGFSESDGLCLDGERLIQIEGAAWKPGSVYAKRHDDLSRVRLISSTSCVGEIAFEVRSADGMIHEYGCRDDAVVSTPRGILRWSLARSVDRFENFIAYEYDYQPTAVVSPDNQFEGLARVDHRLARIRYTGHTAAPVLAPDRTIVLDWEERPDPQSGWFAGAPTLRSTRLREVAAYSNGDLVRRWPLGYEQGEATGRSRLAAVTECAADGVCKPPTTFEWIEGESATDDMPIFEWSADGAVFPHIEPEIETFVALGQVALDANNDGMTDLLAGVGEPGMLPPLDRGWELWRSQPEAVAINGLVCGADGVPPQFCTPDRYRVDEAPRSRLLSLGHPYSTTIQQQAFAIDYDGDGNDDMTMASPEGLLWNVDPWHLWAVSHVVIVRGSAQGELTEVEVEIAGWQTPAWLYAAADLTGDGLGDLVYCRADPDEVDSLLGTWRVLVNQPGIGFDANAAVDSDLRCSAWDKLLLLDHDGDGASSLLVIPTWSDEDAARIPSSKWGNYQALTFTPGLDGFAWSDTGLPPDLAQRWRSPWNEGLVPSDFPVHGPMLGLDKVIDVQGDGLPDLIRYQLTVGDTADELAAITEQLFSLDSDDEHGGLRLWINDGTRFHDGGWITVGEPGHGLALEFLASATIDWNADGRLDLLKGRVDDEHWWVWISDGQGGFVEQAWPGSPYWPGYGYTAPHALAAMDVDGDALHDPVLWDWTMGQFWDIHRHRGEQPDRIAAIVDGLGQRTEIEYQSITDFELPDLHEPGSCTWPANCAERPAIVVERHRLDAGLGAYTREFVHTYAGGRADRLERRWLGFQRHEVTEWGFGNGGMVELGQRTTWFGNPTYDEDLSTHPLAGMPTAVLEQVRDPETGERHASAINLSYAIIPTSTASFRIVEDLSHERTWQLADDCFGQFCEFGEVEAIEPLTHQTHIVDAFDELGFALHEHMSVELGNGVDSVAVQRTIVHDTEAWLIGRVTHETTTHLLDEDPVARTSARAYDPTTGVLVLGIDEPDDPDLRLATQYLHDAFGNVTKATAFDAFGESRTDTFAYDERGRFPIAVTNALGHVTRMSWHDGLSVPHTAIDPNGIRQVLDVDGLGRTTGARVFADDLPRGDDVTIEYLPPYGANGGLRVRSAVAGQGERTVIYDRLARPTAEYWIGPDGEERWQQTHYDMLGRVRTVSLPTFAGDLAAGVDTWTWDMRGRPVMHTRDDGAFERWFYQGLTVEHRDFAGETTRSIHDGAGRLVETVRAPETVERERLCFDYGAFSTLVRVRPDCIAPDVHVITEPGEAPPTIKHFEYDTIGRLVWSDDPSQGERVYTWSAFDELIETLDANDRLVEYEHDLLGRTVARIDDEGVTEWTWDTTKIGTIGSASSPTGIVDVHHFDAFARPIELTKTIAGEDFSLRLDYDGLNRVAAIHYPQAANLPEFAVRNLYGKDGSLIGVRRLADDEPIWQIDEVDAADRIVRESFRNGLTTTRTWDHASGDLLGIHTTAPEVLQDLRYTWNAVGTLAKREDLRLQQWEEFGYDPLHRLAIVHTERGGKTHERHFAYDTLGNLVHATDVGDYEYDERGRLLIAGSTSHAWDGVGNVVHRVSAEGEQQFTWTSFDKPRRLIPAEGGPTVFDYDAEQRRAHRHDFDAQLETIYLLGFYERDRQTTDEGVAEIHRYHVQGRDRTVAEFEITIDAANTVAQQTRYLHDDHLGSIDLVTGEQGEVVQRQSFDAWGKPRDPNDWTLPDEFASELLVNRGYTGHEGRRDAGLVNMNGRLYDPRLGRMVNADPYVVAPDVTIGWNRYAYVSDNPLSSTDPSGYIEVQKEKFVNEDGVPQENTYVQAGSEAVYSVKAQAPSGGEGGEGGQGGEGSGGSSGVMGSGEASGGDGGSTAGDASEEGPDADPRGNESTSRDVGLGLMDGGGNTGYFVLSGAATYAFAPLGVAAGIGYWATGGNPAGAARRTFGRLIGDDTLAADPTSVAYTASLITGEIVSGGVAGLARGAGSGLRATATEAAASCSRSCGRAGGGLGSRLVGALAGAACFVAGTPIAMADGSMQPIETVGEGQAVACVDDRGLATCTVGETMQRRVSTVLDLVVETEDGETATITVTPEHPFYVAEFGYWLDADDLEPDYTLALLDGSTARVVGHERRTGDFEVYNFETQGAHDYFAGPVFVLVHNHCSKRLARNIKAATGVERPAGFATHHIVAGKAGRAEKAREILAKFGIDIDDAANGVYLPNGKAAAAGGKAANHQGLHSNKYYDAVNRRLGDAATRQEAEGILGEIAGELAAGTLRP